MAIKKALSLLLLAVFVLTSTLCVDAAVVNSGSRTAHLGNHAQTVHITVHPRKHRKHRKHKKHHNRRKHTRKHHGKKIK